MSERVCFIDRLKHGDLDIFQTIKATRSIIANIDYDLNDYFLVSPFCVADSSFEETIKNLLKEGTYDLNVFLDYCELVLTIVVPYKHNGEMHKDEAEHVIKILTNALNKIAWVATYDDGKKAIVCQRKDLKAEIVASEEPETIKNKIYRYLSLRSGDKDGKRMVLKDLIDEIDSYCKIRSRDNEQLKKLKQFYQCIRHPIDDPVIEFPFFYEDSEEWMDSIFQMVLDVLSIQDLEKRVEIIVEEEKKAADKQ